MPTNIKACSSTETSGRKMQSRISLCISVITDIWTHYSRLCFTIFFFLLTEILTESFILLLSPECSQTASLTGNAIGERALIMKRGTATSVETQHTAPRAHPSPATRKMDVDLLERNRDGLNSGLLFKPNLPSEPAVWSEQMGWLWRRRWH